MPTLTKNQKLKLLSNFIQAKESDQKELLKEVIDNISADELHVLLPALSIDRLKSSKIQDAYNQLDAKPNKTEEEKQAIKKADEKLVEINQGIEKQQANNPNINNVIKEVEELQEDAAVFFPKKQAGKSLDETTPSTYFNDDKLREAQTQIYEAIYLKQESDHRFRRNLTIGLAASVIGLPIALISLGWMLYKRANEPIKFITNPKAEAAKQGKQLLTALRKSDSKSGLSNESGELRKIEYQDSKKGKGYLMTSEQAKRREVAIEAHAEYNALQSKTELNKVKLAQTNLNVLTETKKEHLQEQFIKSKAKSTSNVKKAQEKLDPAQARTQLKP